jgi:hypothetical protein
LGVSATVTSGMAKSSPEKCAGGDGINWEK